MPTLCCINFNSTRQSNDTRRTFINDRLLGPIELSQCIQRVVLQKDLRHAKRYHCRM